MVSPSAEALEARLLGMEVLLPSEVGISRAAVALAIFMSAVVLVGRLASTVVRPQALEALDSFQLVVVPVSRLQGRVPLSVGKEAFPLLVLAAITLIIIKIGCIAMDEGGSEAATEAGSWHVRRGHSSCQHRFRMYYFQRCLLSV